MCGICGFAACDPRAVPLDSATLRGMCEVIRHRGPDDDGQLIEPGIALGMRRLSILDLDTGAQPISSEDENVTTVFNGEIYNFRELRAKLAGSHRLATHGDTETIVHLYEDHGPRFVEHLTGMYAVAVWDRSRRRLVLTRDRMGVKPLYVAETPDGLAFASEIKCMIVGGLITPELDPLAAELFLAYGYVPGPHTLFAGVRKLAPATTLIWEDGRIVSEEPYWQPSFDARGPGRRSWQDDQEELLALLRSSVRGQMVSDVPLGVMLSGGLDSSLVTALMTEVSDHPVRTFAVGFAGHAQSELPEARHVAEALGTEHHELVTDAVDHPEMLEDILWHLEEPVADLSVFGFRQLSRLARENVTVALSGQGADEILGGYRKHQVAYGSHVVRQLPSAARSSLWRSGLVDGGSTRARGLRALISDDPAERLLAMSRVLPSSDRAQLFEPGFMSGAAELAIREAVLRNVPSADVSTLTQTLYLDTRLALADQLFLYFDRMSMAESLEVRVPFADHELVSFCLSLPDRRRVWLTRRKELLRRASQGLVTDHVLRRKKQGFFRYAMGLWLIHHQDFVRDVLLDERARTRGQLRSPAVARLIDGVGDLGIKAHQQLLCLLMLELWQRLFVDGDFHGATQTAVAAAI